MTPNPTFLQIARDSTVIGKCLPTREDYRRDPVWSPPNGRYSGILLRHLNPKARRVRFNATLTTIRSAIGLRRLALGWGRSCVWLAFRDCCNLVKHPVEDPLMHCVKHVPIEKPR